MTILYILFMNKCDAIDRDAYTKGSQVVLLATQNQYLNDYLRDDDGSAISRQRIGIMSGNVQQTARIVNTKYPGVGNITWDDFTDCKSKIPLVNDDGSLRLDANNNPIYSNFTRDTLSTLSYTPHTKYMAGVRPFSDSPPMKSLVNLVPIRYDAYVPPEVVVLFVTLLLILVITAVTIIAYVVIDDDSLSVTDKIQ